MRSQDLNQPLIRSAAAHTGAINIPEDEYGAVDNSSNTDAIDIVSTTPDIKKLSALPYPALENIALMLSENDARSFSATCHHILNMVCRVRDVDTEGLVRKLLNLNWANEEIRVRIVGQSFFIPKMPFSKAEITHALTTTEINQTSTSGEISHSLTAAKIKKLLLKKKHKKYRESLIDTLDDIINAKKEMCWYYLFTACFMTLAGTAIGLYFSIIHLMNLTNFTLYLGNLCCLSNKPCFIDSCVKITCDDIMNSPVGASRWLASRDDQQSLSWAQSQCINLAAKCGLINLIPNPMTIDGSGSEGLSALCETTSRIGSGFAIGGASIACLIFLSLTVFSGLYIKNEIHQGHVKKTKISPKLFQAMTRQMKSYLTEPEIRAASVDWERMLANRTPGVSQGGMMYLKPPS